MGTCLLPSGHGKEMLKGNQMNASELLGDLLSIKLATLKGAGDVHPALKIVSSGQLKAEMVKRTHLYILCQHR